MIGGAGLMEATSNAGAGVWARSEAPTSASAGISLDKDLGKDCPILQGYSLASMPGGPERRKPLPDGRGSAGRIAIIDLPMPIDWFPLWLSLRVAFVSTALAIAAGLPIAYLLANRDFRGKETLDAAVTLPLVLPPTVIGYYLLVVIGRASPLGRLWERMFGSPLVFTWKAAVIAALLHSLPLLVKSSRAALESVDRSCERAARTLGASEWRLFWRITVPLARRSILAASALAFARSLGEFGATLMVAGNIPGRTQTAALAIYDAYENGNTTLALTLVLVVSAAALAILALANRLGQT